MPLSLVYMERITNQICWVNTMTKSIVVAINKRCEGHGSFSLALQPSFTIEHEGKTHTVLIHYNPEEGSSVTGDVCTNYDVIIDNHYTIFKDSGIIKNCIRPIDPRVKDKVSPLVRYGKSGNMFHAHDAGIKHGIEVLCPYAILREGDEIEKHPQFNRHPEFDKVIFKPENAANGDRQIVIPYDKYFIFAKQVLNGLKLQQVTDNNCSGYATLFVTSNTRNEDMYDKVINPLGVVVLPFVEDVVEEYRVLRGGDFIRVAERKLTEDQGFIRVDSSADAIVEGNELNDYEAGRASLERFISLDKVKAFLDDIDFYYGSVDIYIRKRGDEYVVGIFEYSTQHGVVYVSSEDHIQMAQEYIKSVLLRKGLI